MEYFLIGLILILLLLLAVALYNYRKVRLDYYESLGAKVVGYRYLINPVARLSYENMDIMLLTEGPRGMHSLVVQVPVDTLGYIRLRKSGFLDKVFFQ
ncbi:MAG: hypothetical protein ACK4FY_03360, partial [Aquificaceae bacterium]